MSYSYRRKSFDIKKIVCGVLVLAALLTVGSVCISYLRKDTIKIKSTEFSIGALDDEGKYVESTKSIYTKEAFECAGLCIEPDFEAEGTYDIYFYNHLGTLVDRVSDVEGIYNGAHPLAKTARIVFYPKADTKDFKISALNVLSYAKKLDIRVSKDQEYKYDSCSNLYDDTKAKYNMSYASDKYGATLELVENNLMKVSENIIVTKECTVYDLYVRRPSESDIWTVSFICSGSDDKILVGDAVDMTNVPANTWVKMTIEVPEYDGTMYLSIRMPKDAECYIFGYDD